MTSYLLFIATMAGLYALLALSLVVVWGQGGMVNLGLVGFFGLGAYISALLVKFGVSIPYAWLAALVLSGLLGSILCFVVRSLSGDYLAIVTLGFAEVLRLVELNEKWLTGGSDGMSGIKGPLKEDLGQWFPSFYFVLTWATVAVAVLMLRQLLQSPFGRALRAVRDDEQVAAVAGKSVLRLKLQAFGIGTALAGIAGAIYAHFVSFIAPDIFVPQLTIYIFLAATAGGYTRLSGAVVGAIAVISLLEATRFIAGDLPWLDATQAASLREFIIAVALIIVMHLRPDGLFAMSNEKSGLDGQAATNNVNAPANPSQMVASEP
jgi:branched-chain amino acid transport system permease protein